jgi:hypothetical protein
VTNDEKAQNQPENRSKREIAHIDLMIGKNN